MKTKKWESFGGARRVRFPSPFEDRWFSKPRLGPPRFTLQNELGEQRSRPADAFTPEHLSKMPQALTWFTLRVLGA
jgi:hypothetical protein